jgi:beta-lactamase superfamily II metal-dependent hydrolase
MIDKLYVYEANKWKQAQLMEETGLGAERFVYLGKGDYISLRKNNSVYLEILHPERKSDAQYQKLIDDETDENLLSLVFKITFSGRKGNTALLITGDMGEEGEKEMIREYGRHVSGASSSELCSEILKVGHHGSKTSSMEAFLDAVRPEFAVIQVGKKNMYGHPAPEALQRLAVAGAAIYRNDLMGAVGFEIKKGEVVDIKTMINDE